MKSEEGQRGMENQGAKKYKYRTDAEEITRLMEECVAKDFEILSKDKLIAEMKAALEGTVEWMEFTIPRLRGKCPHCGDDVDAGGLNWGGPIGAARNAIAKAEGRGE